ARPIRPRRRPGPSASCTAATSERIRCTGRTPPKPPSRRSASFSRGTRSSADAALRMEQIYQIGFWTTVFEIILINILLSGDNAIVIALACRRLPRPQRRWGMIVGAGVASVLLILFTGIVSTLMTLPYLRLIGGCALFWIAFRLLVSDDDEHHVE